MQLLNVRFLRPILENIPGISYELCQQQEQINKLKTVYRVIIKIDEISFAKISLTLEAPFLQYSNFSVPVAQ